MKFNVFGELLVSIDKEDGFTATLRAPIVFEIDDVFINVAAGWNTDWASVPRLFWVFFPPMGKHTYAAVLHDFLYKFKSVEGKRIKRSIADKYFLRVMVEFKVARIRRKIMYWMVRMFGWSSWIKWKQLFFRRRNLG